MTILGTILTAFLAFGLSLLSICLLLRYWRSPRGLDAGDLARKAQVRPVLRLGGLGVFAGLAAAILVPMLGSGVFMLGGPATPDLRFLLVCALMFLVGFSDDLRPLSAETKLLAQIIVAVTAFLLGFRIEVLSAPLGDGQLALGTGVSLLVTVFWLIAIPNIINMVDGLDGLAGGIGFAIAATLGVVSLLVGKNLAAAVCFGMAGALGGFLRFNLPPAKIYLGDGGAYLVGIFIGLMSIVTSQKGTVAASMVVVLIALAFPIADASFAIVRRFVYGLPIFRSDGEHLHHRLSTLGMPRGWLLACFYGTFLVLCILGLIVFMSEGHAWPIAAMILCILGIVLVNGLGYFKTRDEIVKRLRRAVRTRREVKYAHVLSRFLEHELDRTSNPDVYWSEVIRALERLSFRLDRPEPEEEEMWTKICVSLHSRGVWELYHPRDYHREKHWLRIAQCLVPPICGGLRRWHALPDEFALSSDIRNVEPPKTPPTGRLKEVRQST